MNNGIIILGLLLVIGYFAMIKRRKFGFKHIKTNNSIPTVQYQVPSSVQPNYTDRGITPEVDMKSTTDTTNIKVDRESPIKSRSSSSIKVSNSNDSSLVKMSSDTIADLFTPKINDAEELGISEEELEARVQEYQNKYMKVTSKPLPQNIHFNTAKYDNALRDSIRDSAISMAMRGSLYNDVDDLKDRAAKQAAHVEREMNTLPTNGRVEVYAPIRSSSTSNRIIH